MKKYILFLLLSFVSAVAMSQVSISYSIGYGTNNIEDMRDLLKHKLEIIKPMTTNATISDDFASPLIHTVEISYTYKKEEFGVQISMLNTMGRITYDKPPFFAENTEEKYDLKGIRLGTMYRRPIKELTIGSKYKLVLFGEFSPGVSISTLKYSGSYKFNNGIDNADGNVSKVSISVLPSVGGRFNFTKDIGLQAAVGYDLNFGGKIDDSYQSKIDWSGVRAKAGVYYIF